MSAAMPDLVSLPFELKLGLQDLVANMSVHCGQTLGRLDLIGALGGRPQSRYLLSVSKQVFQITGSCPDRIVCKKITSNMKGKIITAEGAQQVITGSDFQLKIGETVAFSGFQCSRRDGDLMEIEFPDMELRNCFTASLKSTAPAEESVEEPGTTDDDEEVVEMPVDGSRLVLVKEEPRYEAADAEEEPKAAGVADAEEEPKAAEVAERTDAMEVEERLSTVMVKAEPGSEKASVELASEEERASMILVKSEIGETMECVQSVRIHIVFPKRGLELLFDAVEPGWEFGRETFSQESDDRVKGQIPRQVFVIDDVEAGGQNIKVQVMSPRFKCFLVSEDATQRELPDLFYFARQERVLFVNKTRQDDDVLFTLSFSEDEVDLLSEDNDDDSGEESLEEEDEGSAEESEECDSEYDSDFVDNSFEDVGLSAYVEVDAMLKISKQHLKRQCGEDSALGIFMNLNDRDEVMAAHGRLKDHVQKLKLALEVEKKESIKFAVTNVDENEQCDGKPFQSFEDHRKLLEGLYIEKHLGKGRNDESCFGYRPLKPADEEGSQADAAKPTAKRPRVIKPAVVPHTDGDKGPAEGSAL